MPGRSAAADEYLDDGLPVSANRPILSAHPSQSLGASGRAREN
jgi:hypothetical protein